MKRSSDYLPIFFGYLPISRRGTAATFIPSIAARSLPEQRFAQVSADQMKELNRSLGLVWYGKSAESRASIRRALARLKRALA